MVPNSPKEKSDDCISISRLDAERCDNLHQFFNHPKFHQFLRLFNTHRCKPAAVGVPRDKKEVTADDLKNDLHLAQEAHEFAKNLHLQTSFNATKCIGTRIVDVLELIKKRNQLLDQLEGTDMQNFATTLPPE